ncbi:MAG: flagellin lysine-N-methylase [Bacillota bacterium]|nr:flagellin lysine-N-methylase [Bacillota bacterium]
MGERRRAILVPQYLKEFRCIGSACEDSCCVGWRVDIDNETFRKYQKVKDEELTDLFSKYMHRNRATNHTDANYAKIKLMDESRCPFLNESSLCKIQIKRGPEYLSDVCTTYPRITNIVNDILEKCATMSCPEAARIALLNPKEMEFDECDEPVTARNIVRTQINTNELKFNNRPHKYLWEIRIFTITVLQDRKYRLSDRLIILGLFYQKLQEYLEEKRVDDIPILIGTYVDNLEKEAFGESLSGIPAKYHIQMELLKEIADKRHEMGINSARYMECFAEFMNGIQYNSEATMDENGARYREAWENFYEPYMKDHEYILENYLVNYVFKSLFPFDEEAEVFDAYMMMVIHYALIKMNLIGIAGYHKGLTDQQVIRLIQSFAKAIEHNVTYLNAIKNILKENDYNKMTYMAILIKN